MSERDSNLQQGNDESDSQPSHAFVNLSSSEESIPAFVVNSLLRLLTPDESAVPPIASSSFQDPVEYRRSNPSMPEIVQRLQTVSADRVLVIRRIHPLGLDSPRLLWEYFSLFQAVEDVLLSHTIKKGRNQLRPARVAFVLFREPYIPALLVGDFHVINSVTVTTQLFRHDEDNAHAHEKFDFNAIDN